MENLIPLISCLKPSEVELLRNFYKAKQGSKKKLELFNLVRQKRIRTNCEAAKAIYNQRPNSAFCHLKKRLQEDVYNFLLIGSPEESVGLKEELRCRKMFLQGKILINRGAGKAGVAQLIKASGLANKYEFSDIQLATNDLLRTYSQQALGWKNHDSYCKQIKDSLEDYGKILKAKEVSFNLMANATKANSIQPNLKTQLIEMSNCGSQKARYWYLMTVLQQHFRANHFETSIVTASKLLGLLKQEPHLSTNGKKAAVLLIMAKSYLHLKQYTKSLMLATEGLEQYPTHSWDYLQALQVNFFANYRCGNFAEADNIYKVAKNHDHMNLTFLNKWILFRAALKFSQSRFELVNKTLYQANQIKANGRNWSLGHKLLEILNILELNDYDWFEFKFESFRKKMAQLNYHTGSRLYTIYKLFRTLIRTDYNYEKTISLKKESLKLLGDNTDSYYWDPMGFELINVHDWFVLKSRQF